MTILVTITNLQTPTSPKPYSLFFTFNYARQQIKNILIHFNLATLPLSNVTDLFPFEKEEKVPGRKQVVCFVMFDL